MTDTNQKLREACNYIDALGGDSRSYRQALALPTADHLPNAGKMTNGLTQSETDASASVSGLTAASVGEREAFGYFYIVNGVHEGFCKGVEPPPDDSYDEGTLVPVYRSALSAGDAVDAQRTPLTDEQMWSLWNSQGIDEMNQSEAIAFARDVERAHGIDEAMRKGQL